jgi:hypothetical protein
LQVKKKFKTVLGSAKDENNRKEQVLVLEEELALGNMVLE